MDDKNSNRPLISLIFYYRKLLLDFNKFKIHQAFQKANEVEDVIVKEWVNLKDSFQILLNSPPNVLKKKLFEGAGKTTNRVVHDHVI